MFMNATSRDLSSEDTELAMDEALNTESKLLINCYYGYN